MIDTIAAPSNTNLRKADAFRVMRQRVDEYFAKTGKSKHAPPFIIFKVILLLTSLFLTWGLAMWTTSPILAICSWAVFGFVTALIGMNVAHDGLHGGFSGNHKLNEAIGLSLNLIGGNGYIWKIMHNQVHHTFTNVVGVDDDLEAVPGVRMHAGKPLRAINRGQHIYVWFLYAFATLFWVFLKDFRKFFSASVGGVKRSQHPAKEWVILFVTKFIYYGLFLVLPLMISNVATGWVVAGFLLSHAIGGMTLGIIFQMAHCVEGPEFPKPGVKAVLTESFVEHQLKTTANFATHDPVMIFICGGLNFQVEHHLFPKVSHGHYPAIAPIVKQTALEYGLPYIEQPTFWYAIRSHYRILKRFGHEVSPEIPPAHNLNLA